MQIEKRKKLKLSDVLELFIEKGTPDDAYEAYAIGENFDLYRPPSDAPLKNDTTCYIDDSVTANDAGEEIYPEFIVKNKLDFFYSGERFIDVILNVFDQLEAPSIDTLVDALNYYDENDDFLEIET